MKLWWLLLGAVGIGTAGYLVYRAKHPALPAGPRTCSVWATRWSLVKSALAQTTIGRRATQAGAQPNDLIWFQADSPTYFEYALYRANPSTEAMLPQNAYLFVDGTSTSADVDEMGVYTTAFNAARQRFQQVVTRSC